MNNKLRKVLKITATVFFGVMAMFFIFRNPLLHWGISQTAVKVKEQTGATLDIRLSEFSGYNSISLFNISIAPVEGDTLISADTVSVKVSFWALLSGTIRLNEIHTNGVRVNIACHDSICNYSGFIHEKPVDTTIHVEKNYAILLKRLLDRVFNLAPQKASLHNISLHFRNDTLDRTYIIPQFHSDESSVAGTINDLFHETSWACSGKFSQRHHLLDLKIFPADKKQPFLPVINELFGLAISFDTLHIALNGYSRSGEILTANGTYSVKKLLAYHKKVAADTIKLSEAAFDFVFHAGKSYFEIDSASNASLASIKFHPYIKYSNDKSKEYCLNINSEKTPATSFFSSLPEGMFDEVRDIEADGSLQYSLNFKINSSYPDSVLFETSLKKEKFRLRKFGSGNLGKMNSEFLHQVYERDRLVRTFMVGPSNPYFTPLEKISPDFVNAVLTSEDGNFFYHNGFNEDAFRKSIVTNFKSGKFQRGGSTISMQLVKNVFLNRKKTIARKAEEALIVWLIESNRIYSKQRMLEVYMNIIELGPDVYGIGEASVFYFNKTPLQLSLPEGIFLASLLPRPKWFKYSFDTLGNLKPFLADYYRIVSDFMLRKELITQQQHDELLPHIILLGPAREMVVPKDTIPIEDEDPSL